MASLIGKARKPKFELYLKIYDLNNVPLVSGSSFIKWHLTHSMHAEHRGRTSKCPISNHCVDYSYSKHISHIRISIDRTNNLAECPLELEVVQEFAIAEKIVLGTIKLNLSEYIEESEAVTREVNSPPRKRSSGIGVSPTDRSRNSSTSHPSEEGVVRRYLMQDSKVNSTLKIGILMVQVDGERNFVAPPLKAAPVFGGITGLMVPEQVEDESGQIPNLAKPRDATEVQDLYRRTLVASWSSQPGELPADECIEDIFSGGNGWKTGGNAATPNSEEEDLGANNGTLRPSDIRRMTQGPSRQYGANSSHQLPNSQINSSSSSHRRTHSGSSDKSVSTVTARGDNSGSGSSGGPNRRTHRHKRDDSAGSRRAMGVGDMALSRSRSGSLLSLAPTLDSDRSRIGDLGLRHAHEVREADARDDLCAWRLPGSLAA